MNNVEKDGQENHRQNYRQLIHDQKTLLLSTVTAQGVPECSYAPFVEDGHNVFYIYVSQLASHTLNMLQNHRASILFIRSENESKNIFARERVIFDCTVSEIPKDNSRYIPQLDTMEEKLGKTIELLQTLPDFHLLMLTPVTGKYIAGFGQAFTINSENGSLER